MPKPIKNDRVKPARRGRPPKNRGAQSELERTKSLKLRRFELKLSEMDFDRIERLQGLTGAASMGEVVRDAVREYEVKILGRRKEI
jgi:hypothetical protein